MPVEKNLRNQLEHMRREEREMERELRRARSAARRGMPSPAAAEQLRRQILFLEAHLKIARGNIRLLRAQIMAMRRHREIPT